jgi:hypothetical protein
MGFFFKALAAIVTADAIDRHARSRPTRYWYPDQPGLPPPGSQMPYGSTGPPPAAPRRQPPPAAWDLEHPERPSRAPKLR